MFAMLGGTVDIDMTTYHPKVLTVDTLHVEDSGRGRPAFLFLHYWGGSARTWRPVIDRLASTYRCVAYDQRGWGRSGAPAEGFGIKELSDDAIAVVGALGLEGYVLVGHSMGGKVAQALAARHPPGLRGLALVAPAPAAPVGPLPDEARTGLLSAYADRESVLATVDGVLTHTRLSDPLREQVVGDSLGGTPAATVAWPTATISEDVSADLGDIDVPVLVIGAEHDVVEPVDLLEAHVAAAIPGARLGVIADSGHLIPLEQPGRLADRLAAFAASLAPGGQ